MEIIRNLSDDELNDLLLASDQQCLRQELAAIPEQARAVAARPEVFWERQRQAIWSRAIDRKRELKPAPMLAWAALATMIVAGVLLLNGPKQQATPHQAQTISDEELLIQVEREVQRGGPQSLQPAALLADEIAHSTATPKQERNHEN